MKNSSDERKVKLTKSTKQKKKLTVLRIRKKKVAP